MSETGTATPPSQPAAMQSAEPGVRVAPPRRRGLSSGKPPARSGMGWLLALLALAGGVGAFAFIRNAPPDAPLRPAVVALTPGKNDLLEIGTIEAFSETIVVSRFGGEVVWKIDEGTFVEAGMPVVKFETKTAVEEADNREKDLSDKQEALRRAKADIDTARERYKHVVRQEEIKLALAELEHKRAFAMPEPDDKLDAELTLKSAAFDLAKIALETKGYEDLAKEGYVSEAKRKEKQLELATQKANHAKAKLIYDLTLMGATTDFKRVCELAVADARKRLNITKFNYDADMSILDSALELAQVDGVNFERDLKRKRELIELGTVRAPVRGSVVFTDVFKGSMKSKSPIQVGETRTVGSELCTLCDTTQLRIRVWINESDIKRVELGHKALVQLLAIPGKTFEAVVTDLAVVAVDKNVALSSLALRRSGEAFVNVIQARLDFVNLPEADRREIRTGFTAEVQITAGQKAKE